MKILSLLAVMLVVCLSPLQASPLNPKGDAKITKNEAEHIALKHHEGARVTAAKLEKVEGKLVWSIEILGPKAKQATQVTVDAMSGRILSQEKPKP